MGKLTAKTIESLVRAGTPGLTSDGDGLYFQISKTGGTSWIYRYKIAGKTRDMGLGRYPDVGLADARTLAGRAREVKARGQDPLATRDAERERLREEQRRQEARRRPFETLAIEYLETHGAGWSEQWRKGWRSKMDRYAFPIIGKLPASAIETEHVLRVLRPIWTEKTRTADEVRGQIERVLDAAKAHGLRDGDNPARWRGHLESLLGATEKKKARKRQHFPAMKWQDVPGLMAKLAQNQERDACALRLLILTGARSHMVRFAEWSEFDLQKGLWLLPADRMKMRRPFAIPLAPEAVELLQSIPRIEGSAHLFPGKGRKNGVIHKNAFRDLLHSLELENITAHGFRSTFRDWANERTHYPREVCELALAHDERDQTEGAYSRSDFLEKRRALMADWAQYATTPPAANVIQADFKRTGEAG